MKENEKICTCVIEIEGSPSTREMKEIFKSMGYKWKYYGLGNRWCKINDSVEQAKDSIIEINDLKFGTSNRAWNTENKDCFLKLRDVNKDVGEELQTFKKNNRLM